MRQALDRSSWVVCNPCLERAGICERQTRVKNYLSSRTEDLARTHDAVTMARRLLLEKVMATLEERLDELLAMSREVGRLSNEAARLEHAAEYGKLKDGRRRAREALAAHLRAEERLARARARFLAALSAESAS